MSVSTNIKRLRLAAGLTQEQLADKLGITRSTITQWETGWSQPRMGMAEQLAQSFNIPLSELVTDFECDLPNGAIGLKPVETVAFPVYGRIAAGTPIEMLEIIEEVQAPIGKRERHPYSYFLLVEGDSMNNEVLDGSYVLIDPESEPHNGDTVAINVNGYDAALKVYHKTANSIILSPNSTNPEHKDLVIDETNPDAPNLRILGKKVWAMYPDVD
jgi:repressor LexA